MKDCRGCGRRKRLSSFPSWVQDYGGGAKRRYRNHCKACKVKQSRQWKINNAAKAENHRLRKYGINQLQYLELLDKFSNRCFICHRTEKLVIDHDHVTGVIRGILCKWCNTGIGMLKDDVNLLENAVKYLRLN